MEWYILRIWPGSWERKCLKMPFTTPVWSCVCKTKVLSWHVYSAHGVLVLWKGIRWLRIAAPQANLQSSAQHTGSELLQLRLPAQWGSWTPSAVRCKYGPPLAGTTAHNLEERGRKSDGKLFQQEKREKRKCKGYKHLLTTPHKEVNCVRQCGSFGW